MIVGQQKPFDEIWEMVKGFKKVLVFGCNTCVAICHAGGGKEAEILTSLLRMKAAQEGVDMQVDNAAIERHCEPEFFEPLMEKVRTYDLVLSTACGVGVNFLSDRIGAIPVYPGINTTFYGAVPEAGFFVELCGRCGNWWPRSPRPPPPSSIPSCSAMPSARRQCARYFPILP